MLLAIREKGRTFLSIIQLFASSQFNGILTKSLLHASHVIGLLLFGIDPLIQKEIGNVTQQQGTSIVYRHQSAHQIISWVTTIIPITFRQRTDVYQIIRFKDNKRRGIGSVFIEFHIQQVQLGMSPKVENTFGKLIIHSQLIVSDFPIFFRHFIDWMNIQELIISIIKADTDSTDKFNFLPFHRRFPLLFGEHFI